MVNMKQDPKALQEKYAEPASLSTQGPSYPYGLELRLEDESIDKLGLEDLPKVGSKLRLEARVEVTSCSVHEDGARKTKRRSVTLQITDMELEAIGKKKAEEKLYDNKD